MDPIRIADEILTRPEFVMYATDNPYAEREAEHSRDVARHATALWQEIYKSDVPQALIIASRYHDIDRAFPPGSEDVKTARRMIDTKNLPDQTYTDSEVKTILHPQNCAAIFRDYNPDLPEALKDDISYLIERHELGRSGVSRMDAYTSTFDLDDAAEVLCEADGLSFFTVIMHSYVIGRSQERIQKKMQMSYDKLSHVGKAMVAHFRTGSS